MGEYLASMGPAVANHLWQSTAFAVVAAGLALALKKNHARARYWVWMAASMKFVVPFAVLIGLGGMLPRPQHAVVTMPVYSAVDEVGLPFDEVQATGDREQGTVGSSQFSVVSSQKKLTWPVVAAGIWVGGVLAVLGIWCGGWLKVMRTLRQSVRAESGREVEALRRVEQRAEMRRGIELRLVFPGSSLREAQGRTLRLRSGQASGTPVPMMEPGIFGVWRPVLIWPEGLSERLNDEQVEAILAHELAHARRRDNLTAALHMLVEAAFWFYPVVWWLGARLVAERERACDEAVVEMGSRPGVYAESLLKAVRFCVESPLECMAGVTGADLKQRVMEIMTRRAAHRLSLGKKVLLVAAVVCAAAVPVVLGQAQAARRMMLAAVAKAPMPVRVWAEERGMVAEEQTPSAGLIAEVQAGTAPTGTADPTRDDGAVTNGAPGAPFKFDVVSIRPADPNLLRPRGSQFTDDGFVVQSLSLVQVLMRQYQSELPAGSNSIVGGADWVRTQQWDIHAKVADSDIAEWSNLGHDTSAAAKERRRATVEAMLAERFRLKTHFDTKEGTVYTLVVGKDGSKLKPSASELPPRIGANFGNGHISSKWMTIGGMAALLAMELGRPVIDKSGMTGNYEVTLDWTPDQGAVGGDAGQAGASSDVAKPSLFTAVQEQLGLRLEAQKGPIETLVIDGAEKPSVDGAEVDPTHRDEAAMNGAPRDLKQELHGVYKVWLDQDVRWIVSDREAQAFKQLTNDEERDKFIEQFWQIRNPTPGAAANAYRDEYYARIAWANEHFAENEPGWMTDRGHVYIVYGKPDEVYAQPGVGAETWTYRHIVGVGDNVVLKFAFVAGLGPHRLVPPLPVGLFGQAADPTGMQGPNPLKRRLSVAAVLAEQSNPPRQSLDRAPGPGAAARPQFEVASVKPVANDRFSRVTRDFVRNEGRPGEIAMAGPDRVRLQNSTLLDLIATAYSVRTTQVSGPTWLSDQGFDIEAKVPEGAPKGELNAMLQSLLEERFGLKVHRGTQAGPGFALVVGKDGPKLSPAKPPAAPVEGLTDEEQKAQLQQKMQADMAVQHKRMQAQLAAVGPFNNVGWSSITTEELAAQLVRFVGAPVIDETGLTGEYKVTIDTWNNPDVPGGTIFDAVEKLGLKLESRKVTIETVVVDEVSKTPTAN